LIERLVDKKDCGRISRAHHCLDWNFRAIQFAQHLERDETALDGVTRFINLLLKGMLDDPDHVFKPRYLDDLVNPTETETEA
jgi:hypothetical protein